MVMDMAETTVVVLPLRPMSDTEIVDAYRSAEKQGGILLSYVVVNNSIEYVDELMEKDYRNMRKFASEYKHYRARYTADCTNTAAVGVKRSEDNLLIAKQAMTVSKRWHSSLLKLLETAFYN